jgi:hypothetical protein
MEILDRSTALSLVAIAAEGSLAVAAHVEYLNNLEAYSIRGGPRHSICAHEGITIPT